MKLFDYPGAVKVWLYQVVSCCIHNISNSFDFPILHWEPHGARNEVSESHDTVVEVLVYSSGLSCEKLCSTLQYPYE